MKRILENYIKCLEDALKKHREEAKDFDEKNSELIEENMSVSNASCRRWSENLTLEVVIEDLKEIENIRETETYWKGE